MACNDLGAAEIPWLPAGLGILAFIACCMIRAFPFNYL